MGEKFSDDEPRQHIDALSTCLGTTLALHFIVLLAFRGARLAGRGTCTEGIKAQSRLARAECAAHPTRDAAVHAQS